MSNAKLKEQIEAAKVALVHAAEAGTDVSTPPTSCTVTQIPSIGTNHAQPRGNSAANKNRFSHIDNTGHVDSVKEVPHALAGAEAQTVGQDTIVQSDFEKLEARLKELEDRIKNQQRDLHTLLQKLRDITAKSQAAAEPKKSKRRNKTLAGATLCLICFGAVYYWLGAEVITGTLYQMTGFIMAFIDTLASKI